MGILRWLRSSLSPRETLLAELADICGRNHSLVERLTRHAAMCAYVNIRAGLEQLAFKEAAHVKALNAILADNGLWSRPPEPPTHEGANNWERLSADLELLAELSRAINRQGIGWEPIDSEPAKRLFAMYAEDCGNLSLLRDLTLKCDPQAFD